MKLPNRRTAGVILLVIILVVMGAALVLLASSYVNYRRTTNKQLDRLQGQLLIASANAQLSHGVMDVKDNLVYLPELRLKLPMNSVSQKLVYSPRSDMVSGSNDPLLGADVATVGDVSFVDDQPMRLACMPVRIGFGTKTDAYNNSEKPLAPIRLADGRTMQIYVDTAVSCKTHWTMTGTDPQRLGELMQEAVSY